MAEYMSDCVHLKACRRYAKRLASLGISVGRACNEKCTAYEDLETFADEHDLYTEGEVRRVISGACEDGKRGYYPGDLLISDYV